MERERQAAAQRSKDEKIIYGVGTLLAVGVSVVAVLYGDDLQDFLLYSDLSSIGGLGPGDVFGAALWSVALYFTTPLQLLLLFLGRVDTERPSDWLLSVLGRAAGLPVDAVDYSAPTYLRVLVLALCGMGGVAVAVSLNASLGDATWSVSSGIGSCMAAGIYEIGRPDRLSTEQAVLLEAQWQDFAGFANERLQRTGRAHETEVFRAFRQSFARYRSQESISDATLRDMVRNWHPDAQRTPGGYYKNLAVQARVDPFTGKGGASTTQAAAAASVGSVQGSSSSSSSANTSSSDGVPGSSSSASGKDSSSTAAAALAVPAEAASQAM